MVEGFGADDGIILEPPMDADVGEALPQATRINTDDVDLVCAFICVYLRLLQAELVSTSPHNSS